MSAKCLLLINTDDVPYARNFSNLLPKGEQHKAIVLRNCRELNELAKLAEDYDFVVTTSHEVCGVLFGKKFKPSGTDGQGELVSDYQGNIVKLPNGIEVLVMNPFRQLYSTDTGTFLAKRFLSKITHKNQWMQLPKFVFNIVDTIDLHTELLSKLYDTSGNTIASSVDIETNSKIYCVGFGIIERDTNTPCGFKITNYCLPLKDAYDVNTCRQALESPVQKIFQNGLYDTTQLLTYAMPVHNWLWDTLGMFHSWYSELPRRLDFISCFMLRDAIYWKDEKKSDSLYDKYVYNCKDTYITSCIFIAWIIEAPEWAKKNYLIKFPEVFPNLYCGLEGIAVDPDQQAIIRLEQSDIVDKELDDVRVALGAPNFNPNSPIQVKKLLNCFGFPTATSTDKKVMALAPAKSPVLAYTIGKVIKVRKARKMISTYIDAELLNSRLFYTLNPFGTDTGRTASKASNLHYMDGSKFISYGGNIQNQPPYAKQMLKADEGFELFEIDKSASESWCTAYLSRDPNLLKAVHEATDFHCHNASMFFGIPFEKLFDATTSTVLQKPIRQLSKRINHGANYNMGAGVLLDTMGEEEVWKAKVLILGTIADKSSYAYTSLNGCTRSVQVCQYLLDLFDKAYPNVRGRWQAEITKEVTTTGLLTSPSGWTRRCFGNPALDKQALNAYVAHGPQHLSVQMVNKSFVQIWRELMCNNTHNFRLKAQVHDSIFGQNRIGFRHLVEEAELMMRVKVIVHGKELTIPNDIDAGKIYWK